MKIRQQRNPNNRIPLLYKSNFQKEGKFPNVIISSTMDYSNLLMPAIFQYLTETIIDV